MKFDSKFAESLKDIKWKDINVQFKNDFEKTENYVLKIIIERGCNKDELLKEIDLIYEQIVKLNLEFLGKKTTPPEGY